MARAKRTVIPGFPHHVVVRGNNRRLLFSYPGDYRLFLFFLGSALERSGCKLNAMTMMSNHVHLLLTPPDADSLSSCVKRFSQRYAQARNKKRDASGKLFEQRFWSRPVLTERQVGIVTAYIHANPIRSGSVDDAIDYRWSTHAMHVGEPARCEILPSLWTPSSWYRELSDDAEGRIRAYLSAFAECLLRQIEPEYVNELEILESISAQDYTLRLRRPDGLRASEAVVIYSKRG